MYVDTDDHDVDGCVGLFDIIVHATSEVLNSMIIEVRASLLLNPRQTTEN
jgi:hypothetical protein